VIKAPLVAFGEDGSAAVAFTDGNGTYLATRVAGRFGKARLVAAGPTNPIKPARQPVAVAFGGDGRVVLLVDNFIWNGDVRVPCCDALETWFVGRSSATSFGGTVTPWRNIASGSLTPDRRGNLLMTTTTGFGAGDSLRVLAKHAARFGPASAIPGVADGFDTGEISTNNPPVVPLAVDGTDGTFAGWPDLPGPQSASIWWNYRPAGGAFGAAEQLWPIPPGWEAGSPLDSASGSSLVAAAGRGRAAVAWEISQQPTHQLGPPASLSAELLVAVGGAKGFATPVALATAPAPDLSGPWGLYLDSAGNVTVSWAQCVSQRCGVQVVTVRRTGKLVPSAAFSVTRHPGVPYQSGLGPADSGPVLAGDRRGDLIVAWSDQNGVYAAVRKAGHAHFGRATQLSPRVTPPSGYDATSTPLAAFGPNGVAIVTWCQEGNAPTEMAAVYRLRR
jgi:hypothetical protein